MPQLGLTMEEGTIERWLKKEGDEVEEGEIILEIMTDKVSAEVEAPSSGTLGPILYPEETTVPIGETIAYLLAPGEEAPEVERRATEVKADREKPEVPTEKPDFPPAVRPADRKRLRVSPRARRLADELGIDLSAAEGTGPRGRIVEKDVRRVAETLAAQAEAAGPAKIAREGEVSPLEGIRKIVAERMVHSFTTAPHFYLSVEVEAGLLLRMRESLVNPVLEETGVRLTISDLLIKIAGEALREYPEVNAVWTEEGVLHLETINVGLAVATDRGLIVPVLRDANQKTLTEIAPERHALTEKARAGELSLQDVENGSLTISNLGMYRVDQFNAIINPPQAAILAVGRIKERPTVVEGQLTVKPTMFLTLSVDHRILDGAAAARFLDRLVALIEEPYLLVSL